MKKAGNNSDVSIYIATHKKFIKPNFDYYIPIRVGAKINDDDFGYTRDDSGKNISEKNKNYCELTAMYWIWKNDESSIVGLTHYRRYFVNNLKKININNVISKEKIKKILQKKDIIVPNPLVMMKKTVEKQYDNGHKIEDLKKCGEIIKEKYPDYYLSYKRTLKRHYYYNCNMIICNKKIFDEYMEWLFSILFTLEKGKDLSNYDSYQKRIYGFLSERLFNVWLEKNKHYKLKIVPIINFDLNFGKQKFYYYKDKVKLFYFKYILREK